MISPLHWTRKAVALRRLSGVAFCHVTFLLNKKASKEAYKRGKQGQVTQEDFRDTV